MSDKMRSLINALDEGHSILQEDRPNLNSIPDENKDRIGKNAIVNGKEREDLIVVDYGQFYRRSTQHLIQVDAITGESITMHLSSAAIQILNKL